MKKIIITTTNDVSGKEIEEYLGLVNTNMVVGTNFFSDFAASFTDFFGGMSSTYKRKLRDVYQEAYDDIETLAKQQRADAVVGLKVDFDEISGKSKSMFMVSITGTAVRFKNDNNTVAKNETESFIDISDEEVENELFIKKWNENEGNKECISYIKLLKYLDEHPVQRIAESVIRLYCKVQDGLMNDNEGNMEAVISSCEKYIQSLDRGTLKDCLYRIFEKEESAYNGEGYDKRVYKLLTENNMFDPVRCLDMFEKGKTELAASLLSVKKQSYSTEDIRVMRQILDIIESLPDKGKIETRNKQGIFGKKEETVYVCPKGHDNDPERTYCFACGLNIKGLSKINVGKIERYKTRLLALEEISDRMN